MPRVNLEILQWARETAGLSLPEATKKLGLRAARGVAAEDRLRALEQGKETPTRAMLVKMAKQYRRPLVTFYLDAVPRRGDRGEDFRTTVDHSKSEEAILDALIRSVRARQSLVRAALEDDEDASPLPWVGSMSQEDGVSAVLASLRQALALDLDDFRAAPNPTAAFDLLRSHTEALGVFVLLQGSLGTYHTALGVDTFRGFALADPIAPFVVVNDQDSRTAWSFTLLHELVHVWLGQTAISGGSFEQTTERFCNDVASEYLVPSEEISELVPSRGATVEDLEALISGFAEPRNVSRSMVAYRLYRHGAISKSAWRKLHNRYREKWLRRRQQTRREARRQEGGPSYYTVRRHRLGQGLLRVAKRLLQSQALPTSKIAQVLGVKSKQVHLLLDENSARQAS